MGLGSEEVELVISSWHKCTIRWLYVRVKSDVWTKTIILFWFNRHSKFTSDQQINTCAKRALVNSAAKDKEALDCAAVIYLKLGDLHRRQRKAQPKSSWRQSEQRKSWSLWGRWSQWNCHPVSASVCCLKERESKNGWRDYFCFVFHKNGISSDIFCVSHRLPIYLQFSTSTSADWRYPRSLSENAPPHPSLCPCLAELPVHHCKKPK